ncbi:MAG: tRNA pseudouridine(38-40) synthase TruA [Candidatus Dependentiae bacterium]
MIKQYKLIVAYDGTNYHGWQVQPDKVTVAGTIQDTFKQVFDREIKLLGASRTDAGVHAAGQIATFSSDLIITPSKLLQGLRGKLPADIMIRSLEEVDSFNPRHNVRQKIYYYHFFIAQPLPFFARYGWFYRYPIDFEKLEKALQVFVGTHDFRSFCTGEKDDTVRRVDSIHLEYLRRFKAYRIVVKGPGFLHHMIRRIVGAALEVAATPQLAVHYLQEVLAEKNPLQTLPNAPAQGLMLYKILYDKEHQ